MRTELHSAADFGRVAAWFEAAGLSELPLARLAKQAEAESISVTLLSSPDASLICADLVRRPSLLVLTTYGLAMDRWDQRETLAEWAGYAVVSSVPGTPICAYGLGLQAAREHGIAVLIDECGDTAFDWVRWFRTHGVPTATVCNPASIPARPENLN